MKYIVLIKHSCMSNLYKCISTLTAHNDHYDDRQISVQQMLHSSGHAECMSEAVSGSFFVSDKYSGKDGWPYL